MRKYIHLFVFLFILSSSISCKNGKKESSKMTSTPGINLENMDKSVKPSDDFYLYAIGGWKKNNPLPKEFSRYTSMDDLREKNNAHVRDLIQEISKKENPEGSISKKIADLYKLANDKDRLNAEGKAPVLPILEAINKLQSKDEFTKKIAEISKFSSSPFFSFYIGPDQKNSSINIAEINQPSLGMRNRDYYLEPESKHLLDAYRTLIEKQFKNLGYDEKDSKKVAQDVIDIETQMAKSNFPKEILRQAEKNYHKIPYAELKKMTPGFSWDLYFAELGTPSFDSINVGQIEPIVKSIELFEKTDKSSLKNYLSWIVVNTAAPYLSDDFIAADFDFFGKEMSGKQVQQERWKRAISVLNNTMGEAVGQLYVAKYFPPEAKQRMLKMIDNLKDVLSRRIDSLSWMTSETKEKAQKKLSTFLVKIGYPDKWKDYSTLKIDPKKSYYENVCNALLFDFKENIEDLGKPVDRMKWQMNPHMVNAYYNPPTNEICFPAGILNAPFFNMNADDAVNYGAIGVVIGHEMTHGFDDNGRKYDETGVMRDWWTPEDSKKFEKRAKVLSDFFDNIIVIDSTHANGKFTLGENIADQGGLHIAYQAFSETKEAKEGKKIDGLTPDQRFFISYATLWAGNIRDKEIKRLTKMDPHALCRWRVNGALPHVDAWYKAFGIDEKSPLFVPKEKRVSIW